MKRPLDAARKKQLFSEGEGEGRTSVFHHYRMDRALRAKIWWWVPFLKLPRAQKTPEINELGNDKQSLKI